MSSVVASEKCSIYGLFRAPSDASVCVCSRRFIGQSLVSGNRHAGVLQANQAQLAPDRSPKLWIRFCVVKVCSHGTSLSILDWPITPVSFQMKLCGLGAVAP